MQAGVIEVAMELLYLPSPLQMWSVRRTLSFFTDSITRRCREDRRPQFDQRNSADRSGCAGGILKVSQSDQKRNKRLPDGAVGLGFRDNHKMIEQTKWVLPLAEAEAV